MSSTHAAKPSKDKNVALFCVLDYTKFDVCVTLLDKGADTSSALRGVNLNFSNLSVLR
jgi:hypothetical protein